MHRTPVRSTLLVALCALATAACDETNPTGPPVAATAAAAVSGVGPFSLGYLTRSHPASPCQADAHRQFDFWLGDWNVDDLAGNRIGTNRVVSRADGCIVEESWVGGFGGSGRSLNAYDPETGEWSQTWVASNAAGHLRMYGGLDADGRMVLEGQRITTFGTLFLDTYEWTPLSGGRVRQDGLLEIPAFNLSFPFTGIYVPTDDFQPGPTVPSGSCQAGGFAALTRAFDYAVGEWTVEAKGRAIAHSSLTVDQDGCLFEEVFTTDKGYEAVAYTYYMWRENRWYRTWVDSEGERLELEGGLVGDALVLTGEEVGRGASGQVLMARVSWLPQPGGSMSVVHETSADGGITWKEDLVLDYVQ